MEKFLLAVAVLGAILATGCAQLNARPSMGVEWQQQIQAENKRLEAQGFTPYSPGW